jgi:hypothetical protein
MRKSDPLIVGKHRGFEAISWQPPATSQKGVITLRFVLYTEKSVAQCMTALNGRMQAKGSQLDGWVEKNGHFSLSMSCSVARRFWRRTHLRASASREVGYTVIKGYVPDGVSREGQAVIYGTLLLISVVLAASGNLLPAVVAVFATGALYIPLTGDRINSTALMSEVQRTLGAKPTRPRKAAKASDQRTTASSQPKNRVRVRG